MVFDNLGCNLLTVIKMYKYKGIPIPLVKILTKQILIGLDFLHRRCSIIHTDLKPENILLVENPKILRNTSSDDADEFLLPKTKEELIDCFGNGAYKCKIVDLGNACWTEKHFTDDVQTRQYRSPEVILGHKYDTPIDIWSIGCIVFELLTGDLLFEPKSGRHYDKNDDHLAQIIELLGELPRSFATGGSQSDRYFTRRGKLRQITEFKFWGIKDVLYEKYKFSESDATIIADFLKPMLEITPSQRTDARSALRHPWIKDIDISDFYSAFN